jgi:hypothetical protein
MHQETFASLGQAAIAGVDFSHCIDPALLEYDGQATTNVLNSLLGIESLEMGGRLTDWDTGFERKLRSIFDEADLGIKYSGHVFPIGESFLRMLGY